MNKADILDDTPNAAVIRHPGRRYPGVLIQGDSLRALLAEVDELAEAAVAQDVESIRELTHILGTRLRGLLAHYESVLEAHGIDLPYGSPVRATGAPERA